ncbi:putative invasin [Xenorhabdus nematophila ATCC 19061]|uniref:Invasin n=1 Tax=Xenorhabdus nematophila (strain ATCC 19061 / DSM 3370 / CCUG 14189 / LMG 1036 / NCIMB 9965 / AN6) TaxID=406817 RepID=D3VIN8_XENNA|nr:inverse autotransporter beta domain-containing protein [Xenorhabdus nematophila]CBJ88588.1 putative invasin [Xenorhabdus nematophila ATCC 19061]CEK21501.1 putative invasin [Xenorhabdus nematophila AN6/1]
MNKKFDKSRLHNQQGLLKRVAWVNIVTQLMFPLVGAFTPALTTAETHTSQNEKWAIPTEPYILQSGETINTVAKRYGLTVNGLKKINQLRTFDKPFTALGTGSEIDVPKPRENKFLPFNYSALTHSTLSHSTLSNSEPDNTPATDETSRRFAEASSQASHFLAQPSHIGKNAVSQLSHLAMREANRQIQDWLGRYGTARVQANIDSRGRLNGSQLDMLLPLHDTKSQMIFTQFGLRRIDKRNTINLGVGQRQFFDGWMLGYNAFLDHDFTGENTRFGLGAEYARDYLKLGVNSYFRLSHWKESRLLTDYDERPANGFDLRAQGYVPSLPQLGGKLVYEHYFGDEVGLINKDHRSTNPSAFTAGINYTPIPLLTFVIDRRQDASGNGETQFNMELNYEIGTPWAQQIDPGAVTFKRTLQGSRYDLVDRNNQIVLEYRKREVISLAMDNSIVGNAGDIKPIHISIKSKYGLKEIKWDAPGLFANGGTIKSQGGTHYLLTLPKYQIQGNNTYTVGAIAYDEKGNASNRAEMQLHVLRAEANANQSTFTAKDKELAADGHSKTLLILALKNKQGDPISGIAPDIKLGASGLSGKGRDPQIETMQETQPGIYQSLLTAGEKTGVLKITPQVDGITIKPVEILFVHPEAPLIKNLTIFGKLAMGQTLRATYTFNSNHGDATDKSRYVWGDKGSTDISKGHAITESGKIPDYPLTLSDAGTVKELAVQARNALGIIGNTNIVDTSMSAEQGNHTYDSGKGGTVRGLADSMTTTISTGKVKKGESITLTIKTLNHGKAVRNVAVRVNAIKALNRQNVSESPTVLLNGQSGIYQDFTDKQGMLSVVITDPNGLGVKTTLSVTADRTAAPQTQDVIFTVVTSPDVDVANFWGHMDEAAVAENGIVFTRPKLQAEVTRMHFKAMDTHTEAGEVWPKRIHFGAELYCKGIHGTLPTKEELMGLYNAHPNNAMHDIYGWPQQRAYRSSTPHIEKNSRKNEHYSVNIDLGVLHIVGKTTTEYTICKQ